MASITRRLMQGFVLLAVIVLMLVGAMSLGVWYFQEKITFQPQGPPFPDDSGIEKVDYEAADGQRLFAYIVGRPGPRSALLIAFHGNADLAIRQVEWAHEITRRTGIAVMLAEYRGYMGLPGRPTYDGSRLDSEAAYRFAVDKLDVSPARIALFGHSLGTAVAAELAARHQPAALVLQSPFTSARDMAALIAGRWTTSITWRFVSRVHYDTVDSVREIDSPVSVAHGERDRVIPVRMGRIVYDAARVKGHWLSVPSGTHSDLPVRGSDAYWNWLVASLEPLTLK
jgi:fermentation-respiration switch protein FrsA (DUF1100 family)